MNPRSRGDKPSSKRTAQAAPRDLENERTLCRAIKELSVVELKYNDDLDWRTYQPHCVHFSSADPHQVNVYGDMTANPNEAFPRLGGRNFEVARIAEIRIKDAKFERPSEFDPFAPLYKGGIICSL